MAWDGHGDNITSAQFRDVSRRISARSDHLRDFIRADDLARRRRSDCRSRELLKVPAVRVERQLKLPGGTLYELAHALHDVVIVASSRLPACAWKFSRQFTEKIILTVAQKDGADPLAAACDKKHAEVTTAQADRHRLVRFAFHQMAPGSVASLKMMAKRFIL